MQQYDETHEMLWTLGAWPDSEGRHPVDLFQRELEIPAPVKAVRKSKQSGPGKPLGIGFGFGKISQPVPRRQV